MRLQAFPLLVGLSALLPSFFATDVCKDPRQTCDLNTACALDAAQLPTGMKSFCGLTTTVSPCKQCTASGQNCFNAPECKDSMFLCNYLTAAQKAALPADHPCLNVYDFCCVPGAPNCTNTAPSGCTPSGCSSFMRETSATVDYTKVPCPFANTAFTCTHPECNNTFIYQDIVNTFAANQGCSGEQCISKYIPTVCLGGANVTDSTSANKLACTNRIVSHCTSNPTDPGCISMCPYACTSQPNCPCRSDACSAVYKAPLCVRNAGPCAAFRASFKTEMYRQRFFQPKSANLAYAKNNFGPPSGPFVWSQALTAAKDSCNAVVPNLGDDIATCVQTSFTFCNANPWQTACQTDLSTCGDGFVSWFESCDEGNQNATGGCDASCRTAARWECYQQGTPCTRCIHATGYKVDAVNPPSMCPFCYHRVGNLTTPCTSASFKTVSTTPAAALASDNYVALYCAAVAANGTLRDPGCDSYVNQTQANTVSTIAESCEYSIRSISINVPQLYSLKFAIFTCRFVDPMGIKTDTTPKFLFTNPLSLLSSTTKAQLSAKASAALYKLYGNRTSKLYSLRDLRLSDYYPYVDPDILVNGDLLPLPSPLGRLAFFPNGTNIKYDCNSYAYNVGLIALPPSKNPLQWAIKATMLRLKFMAINTDDATISDFAALSPDELDADSTPVNGVLQFAHLVGRSTQDVTTGVVTDYPTMVCAGPNCLNVEDSIKKGLGRIHIRSRLFDNSCADLNTPCKYPVDPCRYVPLAPKTLHLDPASIRATSTNVIKSIQQINAAATNEEAMQGFLGVAIAASTDVFSDTESLFWSAVSTGTQPKVLKNVANYCGVRKFLTNSSVNPAWLSNPCCNDALADFMCCMPQNVPNGAISVISGIQKAVVAANCPVNADSMVSFLNGAYVGLKSAERAVNSLNALVVKSNAWELVDALQRDCQESLVNASTTPCQSDNDCTACEYSQCRIDPTTMAGKCTVPWNNMIDCTVECLAKSMDPLLLRYLKDDWNLTAANTSADLANAFTRHTADMGCTGPLANSPDIGKTTSKLVCNSTCELANMCEDKDYQFYLRRALKNPLLDFGVAATCTSNGGRRVCSSYADNGTCHTYKCTFDIIQSGCKDETQCIAQCQLPLTPGGCMISNGRWYADSTGIGRCCPPDAYFYTGNQTTAAVCTYQTPNAPALAYQLRDPLCCAANNGTWFMVDDSTGSCCFGRIITIQNAGVSQPACQTAISGWDVSTCLSKCATSFASSCTACQTQSARTDCCAVQTTSANETACLAKKACNNLRLTNANCNDPTPFCAKCTGKDCVSVTKQPSCLIEASSASTCAALGGTWSAATKQCAALTGNNIAAADCLRTDLCPSVTNFTAFYSVVPMYPRRTTRCLFGCYLPSVTKTTCVADIKYMWDSTHGNGTGICVGRRNVITTAAACTTEGGIYLNATKSYFPGAFTTADQCSEGGCVGSPANDGWSSAQCLNTTFGSCDVQCNVCTTQTQPFVQQNLGACFSTDATYCTGVNAASTPCLVVDATTSAMCAALSSTSWRTCSQYTATSTCSNATDPFASTLKCVWTAQPCATRAQCLAQGKCDDFDDMRQQCLDAGWTFGDTCFAFVPSNGSSVTQTRVCNNCKRIDGVCVARVTASTPCPVEQAHPLGCRVYGVTTSAACTTRGGARYTRATTRAQCLSTKACIDPVTGASSKRNATECTKCKGKISSLYSWWPGNWRSPRVESYVWNPNGAELTTVNEWKKTISDAKLSDALARPMIRRMATIQAQKALVVYNSMTEVLAMLACACGAKPSSACFKTNPTGTLVAKTRVFCGLAYTANTGFSIAQVASTCPPTDPTARRRLTESAESATLEWFSFPLASFVLFPLVPTCDSSELNPLVVTSSQGLVYGQLLGPGQGYKVTSGQVDSVDLCLPLSSNVHSWDALFDTLDVATYRDGAFTPLYLQSFLPSPPDQVCFQALANTSYFPIKRANVTGIESMACPLSCASNTSVCVYNVTAQAPTCVCRCGASGPTCSFGCDNGVCACKEGFGGPDCTTPLCPTGSSSLVPCSNAGVCNANGTCSCNANVGGAACDVPISTTTAPTEAPATTTPAPTTTQVPQTTTSAPTPTPTKSAASQASIFSVVAGFFMAATFLNV